MTSDEELKIKIYPKHLAERLISAASMIPFVKLTGAEIAVLIGSLDKMDQICIQVLKEILDEEATERAYIDTIRRVLIRKLGVSRDQSKDLAQKILHKLGDLKIVHINYVNKKYYIPKDIHTSLKIEKDRSFLLFAGKDLAPHILKKEGTTLYISATSLGYAFCKSLQDGALSLALRIARDLSDLDPLAPLKSTHFERIGINYYEICEDCFIRKKSNRRWISTGKIVANTYKLYGTKIGKAAIHILREKYCLHKKKDQLLLVNTDTRRLAQEKINELEKSLRPLKISRLPVFEDDSLLFVKFPTPVIHNGKICGLALSLAEAWYKDEQELTESEEVFNTLVWVIMNIRHLITPDFVAALNILIKRVNERNKLLEE